METLFTLNDGYKNNAGRTSASGAYSFISKNHLTVLIFILACLFMFPFAKIHAQENVRSGHWSTADIPVEQIKKECRYFGGDSLEGFNFDETVAKAISIYSSYIELRGYMYKQEAAFVKSKYQIDHLPYELVATNHTCKQHKILNGGCDNVDFEDGDFTGWTGAKGYNELSTDPLTIFNTGIFTLGADSPQKSCSYHTMITSASGNEYYGNYPALCPNGGTYSVRLGGDNVNFYSGTDCNNAYQCNYPGPPNTYCSPGEVLEQTFMVSATNTLFTFYYAASLNDGGHAPGEQAYFAIQVFDSAGIPIECFSHRIELVAGVIPPGGFLSSHGNCLYSPFSPQYKVYSIPWQADSYNLSNYVGQNLTVKFTAAGCIHGGHFGIGYFDAKCGPAEITASNYTPCNGQLVVLTAPPSASGIYSWAGPGIVGPNNTQSITINASGTYSVTVGTGVCAYPLSIVMNFFPSLNVTANPTTICSGQTSTLSATGATSYLWLPGNLTDSTIIVSPTSTTIYTITAATGVCTASTTVTVNVNATPSVTATASPSSICRGASSALTASGALTYNWSGFGSANPFNITPMMTTTYTVTGTAANGCTASNSTTVIVNQLPIATISASTHVQCFGNCTGTSTATASGGTTPYNYSWSNGGNTPTIINLGAGIYAVTVTDIKGCNAVASSLITQPTLLTSGISNPTNVSCFGGNNGMASVVANGGTIPYSFQWSNGGNTSMINSLIAGSYFITVTDNHGCSATSSVTISQPTQLTTTVSASTNVSCYGGNNGAISVVANGGSIPYSYHWSNGANTTTLNNLVANNYSITVNDNNGCNSTATVAITQPNQLITGVSASTNVSCFGGNNGAANTWVTGGVAPYTYNWSNGANTNNIAGISAGNYAATITDNNGCTSMTSAIITQPVLLTSNISSSNNINCFGGNNGTAIVSAGGGTPPYTYYWSNGINTAVQSNLYAGNYFVTVTDIMGCTSTSTVNLTQPSILAANISASNNVTCFGLNNGSTTISASGGTVPYTYSWSNGFNNPSINGLTAGVYTVTVTDNNNCSVVSSAVITQPTLLTSGVSQSTNVSCFGGSNGTASITANGGVAPYSYFWSNGGNSINTTGLSAGTYNVTTTDNNGCQAIASVIITQPTALTITVSAISNASCYASNNGAAVVMTNGGTAPYNIIWSNGANTNIINGLTAGIYSATIADNHGCIAVGSVNITQPTLLTSNISSSTNVSCYGGANGSATITALGGAAPYNYNWSNGANSATNNNIAAGNYTVTITDNNGCSANNNVSISQPAQLVINPSVSSNVSCFAGSNGSATVTVNGGNAPYSYYWSNGINSAMTNGLIAGNYAITVSDFNGCTTTANITVTQPSAINSVTSSTNTSCVGINDGSASVAVTGGTFPYTYAWSNGLLSSVINGLAAGNYSVTVTDNNGCNSYGSATISDTPPTVPVFTLMTSFCKYSQVPILSNISTNGFMGTWNPMVIDNSVSGDYIFTPNPGQCATNTTLHVTINPLPVIAASAYPSTVCTGNSTVLSATGASTYTWDPGNLPGPTVTVTPVASTVYTVTGTSIHGCKNKSFQGVDIAPDIPVYFTANPKTGCSPLPVDFGLVSTGLIDTNSLHWNFGDPMTTADVSNSKSPEYIYTEQGNFIVSLNALSIYGCPASGTDTITVWPNPIADFTTHPEFGNSDDPLINFYDQSSGASAWNWNFGNPFSGTDNYSTLQNPMHYYDEVGNYTVELIVNNDYNCFDTIAKSIKILESFAFFVPNAFTPNGDSKNEGFKGYGVGIDENRFEMRIWDRWGKLIFETNDYNVAWDGTSGKKNIDSEQSIYVWQINVADRTGLEHNLLGTVALIR